jgi:hypothetical protein
MPTIGIVSSIEYSAEMQTSFLAGLNMAPMPNFIVRDRTGYRPIPLRKAITDLVGAPVDLIVTFGGLIACNAARAVVVAPAVMKFISLIGGRPGGFVPPPNLLFAGCCDLQSFAQDPNRIAWLSNPANAGHFPGGAAFPAANIGLLYNPNSVMSNDEVAHWTGGQTVPAVNGWADPTKFNLDFNSFGATIQAVVISADPYFHRYRENLITAANASGLYICYPLPSFANPNGTAPTVGNAAIIGPDFHGINPINANAACFKMGAMAAAVLGGGNPGVVLVPQAPPHAFVVHRHR